MKNYLTLVLALAVVSSPAFASRARLESLGEGKGGSYYIDDSRNMFLNPSTISHYKKKLMLELGGDTVGTPDSALGASRGQGGFINTFGDFTYALYLNNTSERTLGIVNGINSSAAALAALGVTGNTFAAPDSQIDFMIAGEGSMGWGLGLFYAGNDVKGATGAGSKANLFGARLGIDTNNLAVFTSVGIIAKSTIENSTAANANAEIKGKVGIDAGVTYKMDSTTFFGKFISTGADATGGTTAAPVTIEVRNTQYGLGAGWKKEMTKATNMFTRLEADMSKLSNSGVATNVWNVPVVMGAETAALNWLTLRGSISASLLGEMWTGTQRSSLAGTTTVTVGTGLTFGDVQIDALLGSSNSASPNAAGGSATTGFGTNTQTAVNNWGLGDNMFSRLAMTYNF